MNDHAVTINVTDERGVRSLRTIVPVGLRFGATGRDPEPQWLLDAWDEATGTERAFPMLAIDRWALLHEVRR
jgi:predicted DNA-binding transcriptional regulator YafY